jgi:tetratricopeptide (TPR) repeat protein
MTFVSCPFRVAAGFVGVVTCLSTSIYAQSPEAMATLDRTVAAAENNLRIGERQAAESHYRTALFQGWMILGALHVSNGKLEEARQAFDRASSAAVDHVDALHSLAIVQLQMGDTASAINILARLSSASPRDVPVRLALAQALDGSGKPGEAVQELEEILAIVPDDAELMFTLAGGYLRTKRLDAAERLFAKVAVARPLPQTHVLIGRTYRDLGFFTEARAAFQRALKMDARTRRAHYYLGTTAVLEEGVVRLEQAIAEFRQELKLTPGDPLTSLRLGMALVELRRYDEALPLAESTVRGPSPPAEAWLYLGRCQLGLGRAADAVTSLRRALETAHPKGRPANALEEARLRTIHYQLATALRQTGATADAEREFGEAQRLSARRTDADREELAQYMSDARDTSPVAAPAFPIEVRGFESLSADERNAISDRARNALARTYLNLGIIHAQSSRFARAAELFEMSAQIDPDFPQVQYSLGVAYFNAEEYKKAIPPLTRASEQQPQNAEARRMLAMASFNADDYAKAADLLRTDPKLPSDPALQYAFGLALVRSDRAKEAETIFSRVLTQYPDVPELNVVVGQIHAAQGDYDAAIASLRRAIELKRDVAEAHAALGDIYMRQGNLGAAASSLRDELAAHPRNVRARQTLATVLDLDGRADEAIKELRAIVAVRPTYADARYLFGKILLARGAAAEALGHLEVAARLAPEDANIHYQLGQAYQRLGRAEPAAREFEIYKRLKDKQRGGLPS